MKTELLTFQTTVRVTYDPKADRGREAAIDQALKMLGPQLTHVGAPKAIGGDLKVFVKQAVHIRS